MATDNLELKPAWWRLAIKAGCLLLALLWLLLAVIAAFVWLPAFNRTSFYIVLLATEYGYYLIPFMLALAVLLWRAFKNFWLKRAIILFSMAAVLSLFYPWLAAQILHVSLDETQIAETETEDGDSNQADAVVESNYVIDSYPSVDDSLSLDDSRLVHVQYLPSASLEPQSVLGTVVLIHGGGWRSGSAEQVRPWALWWAQRGYRVIAVNHRKSPQYHYQAMVNDVLAVLKNVKQELHASKAAGPLILQGHSSGGHLALLTAYKNPGLVDATIAFYSPTNLIQGYEDNNSGVLDAQKIMHQLMGFPLEGHRMEYSQASPIFYASRYESPTLLIHGGRDDWVPASQSQQLYDALNFAGASVTYYELPWATHGFDFLFDATTAMLAKRIVMQFVQSSLTAAR